MTAIARTMFAIVATVSAVVTVSAAIVAAAAAQAQQSPRPAGKNWAPPAARIRAQVLSDELMAQHPELVSVTFHGVPPGLTKVYTMFAGSFPERIGKADDQDDIDVIVKGITVLDPKWHRHDAQGKFGVSLPLRDQAGENVGLITFAFRNEAGSGKSEQDFFLAAAALRDDLQRRVPSYAGLFDPAE